MWNEKKFCWERNVFKPPKIKIKKKKSIIYKENDFGFISEIKDLTFKYSEVSIRILLDFSN